MICLNYKNIEPHIRLSYSQKMLTLAYIFFMSSLVTTFVVTMYVFNYIDQKEDRDVFLIVYASCIILQIVVSCSLLKLARKIRLYNGPIINNNENDKDLA
jgi:uncharacterized membrane protein